MFHLTITTDFAAAHSLRDYPGDCANMHGHNWLLEISVASEVLNESGMVIDFRTIKSITKTVVNRLDHKYINDVVPFDKLNPTAENLAKYLFDEIDLLITDENINMSKVVVWETPRACAIYTK